jgi:MFS family permease
LRGGSGFVVHRYLALLRQRGFGLLWTGATASILGDGMTLVALTWLVYERTGSPIDIGLLTFWYSAPVVIGGLGAGILLDRYDPRRVMMADTAARGLVMASVPLLAAAGLLPTWYLFVVAAVYGLLKMVPLAGVPAMIPELVDPDDLTTANALESISFGVGGIVGPAIAGILVATVGAPAVIGIDALTYAAFLACLALVPGRAVRRAPTGARRHGGGLRPAIALVLGAPAILATTVMFMAFNVGEGIFVVLLPVYTVEHLGLDAAAYGSLLASFSIGLLAGAVAVGALPTPRRLGRAIAIGQAIAGITLIGFLAQPGFAVALVLGALFGAAASPLTVWAQTIRMQLIPAELRGRAFALLRTMMQSTPPLGGIVAGFLLAGGEIVPAVVAAAGLIAGPGIVGMALPALAGPFVQSAVGQATDAAQATSSG